MFSTLCFNESGAKTVAFVILMGVVGMVALILAITTGKHRYAEMSGEEFEAEAKRASLLGAAVMEMHEFLHPTRVAIMRKRDKRVEGDSAEASDRPPGPPPAS